MTEKIGRYQIIGEIGKGAMGIVYKGFDPVLERHVAIKTINKSLLSGDDDAIARLKREAQAAARLQHPNIVIIHEYGETEDTAFISMQFIEGKELKGYFDKGKPFTLQEMFTIMSQLLGAISYSHQNKIIHRDIKPANILLESDNTIKVTDFGIARLESSELTRIGTAMGTPNYMSPEQCKGVEVDNRTDIFSAGVILYQFLTNTKPFEGSSIASTIHKVVNITPPKPSSINPSLGNAFDHVIEKCLAKEPENRFANTSVFLEAIKLAFANTGVLNSSDLSSNGLTLPDNSNYSFSGDSSIGVSLSGNHHLTTDETIYKPSIATTDETIFKSFHPELTKKYLLIEKIKNIFSPQQINNFSKHITIKKVAITACIIALLTTFYTLKGTNNDKKALNENNSSKQHPFTTNTTLSKENDQIPADNVTQDTKSIIPEQVSSLTIPMYIKVIDTDDHFSNSGKYSISFLSKIISPLQHPYVNCDISNVIGSIKIVTIPSNAEIILLENNEKKSSPCVLKMPTGNQYLLVKKDGYHDFALSVPVTSRTNIPLTIHLAKI